MQKIASRGQSVSRKAPFAVVEAYNTIRTNLLFLLSNKKSRLITFSSAVENEGKSTTVINTGISFSGLGHKTLVIDADMRKPSVHRKMQLPNSMGLSGVLVGFYEFEDAVNTVNPNLDVLTSGAIPPNPTELLGSAAFVALLEKLKNRYACIIIDTPPVNIVSDAMLVAPHTDGMVLVVKNRSTKHGDLKKAISAIEFAKVKILGTVLNFVGLADNKYAYETKYEYTEKKNGER